MILADISDKALDHARSNVARYHLEERVAFRCADGLNALDIPCGCISIMGMGGEMIATILQQGQARLQGATLVLSAHTDLPLVRQAIVDIGYHFVAERLCQAGGRFYVVWKSLPGAATLSAEEIALGTPLLLETNP